MSRSFFDDTIIQKIKRQEPVSAAWAQMSSNISAEILAEAGFEVLVIDMEHSPLDLPKLVSLMQATKGTDCIPFVRAPWNDVVWCKQILDSGAYGIHVPYVSTREEAEYAVRACKYPLKGMRGIASTHRAVNYGLNKEEYFSRADQDLIMMVAVETPQGVKNIDEIASVEGVDGIFIGPSDLSTSMGYFYNPQAPQVKEAILTVERSAKEHGKFLGTIAANFEAAEILYDRGYTLVYFLSDVGALGTAAAREVQKFRGRFGKESFLL